jgi:hypothetical protein
MAVCRDDLMDLWQTDTCKFYPQQFEHRVKMHDGAIVTGLMSTPGSNRLKALQQAKEAMPEPPQGCNVCHYLYDMKTGCGPRVAWRELRIAGCGLERHGDQNLALHFGFTPRGSYYQDRNA